MNYRNRILDTESSEENIDFQGETENEMEILYADNTETASNVIELTESHFGYRIFRRKH